jgi:hypothetical protein
MRSLFLISHQLPPMKQLFYEFPLFSCFTQFSIILFGSSLWVLTNVVWLSHFRPILWIPIEYIFTF